MFQILDPHRRIYVTAKSRTLAIAGAVFKHDPLLPVVRASMMLDIWTKMKEQGYRLQEGDTDVGKTNAD